MVLHMPIAALSSKLEHMLCKQEQCMPPQHLKHIGTLLAPRLCALRYQEAKGGWETASPAPASNMHHVVCGQTHKL